MKAFKILSIAILFSTLSVSSFAQRFAYVDSEYILSQIPSYAEAQKALDELSVRWQEQIEGKYAEIDKLYKAYQAEQVLLTEEMKTKREDEIIAKEREVKEFQKAKFGVDGELFKKRKQLVEPIQEQIAEALAAIAKAEGLSIIFDKSSTNILFADAKYDKSDQVIRRLGYNR